MGGWTVGVVLDGQRCFDSGRALGSGLPANCAGISLSALLRVNKQQHVDEEVH